MVHTGRLCVRVSVWVLIYGWFWWDRHRRARTHTYINFYSLVQYCFYYFQERSSVKHGKDLAAAIGNILLCLCCCMVMWTNGVILSVGSEDLLKIAVCCNMMLSGLLKIHEPFFYPEGGGNKFLWHVDKMPVRLHVVTPHITIMRTSNLM